MTDVNPLLGQLTNKIKDLVNNGYLLEDAIEEIRKSNPEIQELNLDQILTIIEQEYHNDLSVSEKLL